MNTFLAVFFCMVLGGLIVQVLRAELLFWKIRQVLIRAEAVLGIIEGHNKATDAVADRVVAEVKDVKRDTVRAAQAACETRQAIAEVPAKVVEKIASDTAGDSAKVPVVRSKG